MATLQDIARVAGVSIATASHVVNNKKYVSPRLRERVLRAIRDLDYKPNARTNKPIAQLTLYALALTRLAGLRLFDIKCAWFNEEEYCEFFPRALLAQQS